MLQVEAEAGPSLLAHSSLNGGSVTTSGFREGLALPNLRSILIEDRKSDYVDL